MKAKSRPEAAEYKKGVSNIKFLGTDFGIKYIIAELEGKEITVSFRDSKCKGIHSIEFRINGARQEAKIKAAYPGILRKIQEAALLIRLKLFRQEKR